MPSAAFSAVPCQSRPAPRRARRTSPTQSAKPAKPIAGWVKIPRCVRPLFRSGDHFDALGYAIATDVLEHLVFAADGASYNAAGRDYTIPKDFAALRLRHLADLYETSASTVRRVLAKLQDAGILKIGVALVPGCEYAAFTLVHLPDAKNPVETAQQQDFLAAPEAQSQFSAGLKHLEAQPRNVSGPLQSEFAIGLAEAPPVSLKQLAAPAESQNKSELDTKEELKNTIAAPSAAEVFGEPAKFHFSPQAVGADPPKADPTPLADPLATSSQEEAPEQRQPAAKLPPFMEALRRHWEVAGLGKTGHAQGYHSGAVIGAARAAVKIAGHTDKLAAIFRAYAVGLRKRGTDALKFSTSFSNFFLQGYYLEFLSAAASSPAPAESPAQEPVQTGGFRMALLELLYQRLGSDYCPLAAGLSLAQRLPDGTWIASVSAALKAVLMRVPQIAGELCGVVFRDQEIEDAIAAACAAPA
jgi:DNA-binding Lrp family transcriptional regulator